MRISDWSSDVCSSDLRDRDDIADTKGGTRLSGSCFACALQWFKSAHAVSARRMDCGDVIRAPLSTRSEEHTSELQSLMRISYAVFCLKKKKKTPRKLKARSSKINEKQTRALSN